MNILEIQLEHLHSLQQIHQSGSFSKAAHILGRTQPAISSQIRILEEVCGTELLIRDRKNTTLTDSGHALLDSYQEILESLDRSQKRLREIRQLDRGLLRIAASDTICQYFLAPRLNAFLKDHPGIEVDISQSITPLIAERIDNDLEEIGFILLPHRGQNLDITALFDYQEVALIPEDHPLAKSKSISPQDLQNERLILLKKNTQSRQLMENDFIQLAHSPTNVLEVGNIGIQKEFARSGLGIAIVPDYTLGMSESHLVQIPISGFALRQMALCHKKAHLLSRAAATFLDHLMLN